MKKVITCSALLVVAMLSPGELRPSEELTRKFTGAMRLMAVGAKAKYEGKDEVAWGEYARACGALDELRRENPYWNSNTVASSLQQCRQKMAALKPESVLKDRDLASDQRKALQMLADAATQADEMQTVIAESRDILERSSMRRQEETTVVEKMVPDASSVDSDGDGLTDEQEAKLGTNPMSPDSDGDGLPDFLEVERYGTSPTLADTDNDGLSDSFEMKSFDTNPLDPDTDHEGLIDGDEYRIGTNPNMPDTDGDGDSDMDEVDEGFDPLTHKDEIYD